MSLRLALQLVAHDLCSTISALLLVDHMLSLCTWLIVNRTPAEPFDQDVETMEEALNSCLCECGRKLADSNRSQVFAGVNIPKLEEWGRRCLDLLERQSPSSQPRGLIDFVTGWSSLMALVCDAAPDLLCPLGKSLVGFTRRSLSAGRQFSVSQLSDLFKFIISVDKLDSFRQVAGLRKMSALFYK